jgi:hypothetical protein
MAAMFTVPPIPLNYQQHMPAAIRGPGDLPQTPHVALARSRVRYLGRAAPSELPDGLASLQKPLHELYCENQYGHHEGKTALLYHLEPLYTHVFFTPVRNHQGGTTPQGYLELCARYPGVLCTS